MIFIPLMLMLGAYLAFSWFLFFFPSVLHIPHRLFKVAALEEALCGRMILNIAHRGGARVRIENTIEAFEEASKHSDMLEMDVCETKDGVLVVHHDHELERTCGTTTFIKDLDFKDLPKFKAEIPLNFAPEGMTVQSKGEQIPTLEQVFKRFPAMPMNIELKTPSGETIKTMVGLINTYERQKNTFIGIRGPHQQELKEMMNHKLLSFMNDKEFFFYLVSMVFGLLPFVFIGERSMQVPLWTEEYYRWKVREWGSSLKTHLYFMAMKAGNVLMGLLAYHLRLRGIMTVYWVCNCEDDFRRAIKYGASGIMTDSPELLHNYLTKRKEQAEQKELLKAGSGPKKVD